MSYDELRERLGRINDLSRAASLLAWDERTMMPKAGAEARSEQLATLARVRHEMFTDEAIGRLIDEVRAGLDPDAEPGLDRGRPGPGGSPRLGEGAPGSRRAPRRARPHHLGLRARLGRGKAGIRLRALLPHLEKNVELTRRYADCFEGFEDFSHPYDPLLDEYEPQMSTEEMRRVLGELREGLVPIVRGATDGDGGEAPATTASRATSPRTRSGS